MSWAGIASNQCISFNNLQDAVTTGVFALKNTIPVSTEQITKADADYYVYIDTAYGPYAAKASNQLVVKSNLQPPPITSTLSIAYIDVSGNIRLDANSSVSLTESIEFQVIRSDSHAYTSLNCGAGQISQSNFFTTQTATIASGNTSGQSVDIFVTGSVQTTKIDLTTILWSNAATTAVPNNNSTITSPVTGLSYLITNIDVCTPI
jgi:hypothetical protein